MRRGLHNARAGDVQDVPDVMGRKVRDGGVHIGCAYLGALAVPVVLVDDADRDLSSIDLVGDGLVVGVIVAAGIRLERFEPLSAAASP